jgi:hypothetical protein
MGISILGVVGAYWAPGVRLFMDSVKVQVAAGFIVATGTALLTLVAAHAVDIKIEGPTVRDFFFAAALGRVEPIRTVKSADGKSSATIAVDELTIAAHIADEMMKLRPHGR